MVHRLRIAFAEAAVFREEYERNIVKGGAFIRTAEEFQPRGLVEVELEFGFCGESVVLKAEIVHCVRAEEAGSESEEGVAVQFLESTSVLRKRLERFIGKNEVAELEFDEAEPAELEIDEAESADPAGRALFSEKDISGLNLEGMFEESGVPEESEVPLAPAGDRRKAPRVQTRVQARVDAKSMSLEGRTRDMSESGVLISADASGLPIGKAVKLELLHPVSGERLEVEGEISRHIETEGTVAAVGIEFSGEAAEGEVSSFLEDVSQVERELKRTGIYGVIEVLGIAALVRMFGTTATQGTLTLVSGVEDGSIGFENGMLRYVQMGELRGAKALSRFLSWEQGTFEFHAHLDPAEDEAAPLVLEDAMQEAIRQREELIQVGLSCSLAPAACFKIDGKTLLGESGLTKIEEAVLDLVAAGFSVRRILDVIPEPDAEVIKAVKSLLDGEIIRAV
jgi:PilZ domain/Domain of unknown function (DUF4388)